MVRVRRLAEVNPPAPAFDQLRPDEVVTFMPLETVWADERCDPSRVRLKLEVATGYVRFQAGDILVPKVTPTFQAGRSAHIHAIPHKAGAASTEVHVVRALAGVAHPPYLRYGFLSKPFLDGGVSRFQGVAGLQRVPDEFVRDFEIVECHLDSQRRIADFLDDQVARIDKIVAARQGQIALLRDEYAARVRHVICGTETHSTGIAWMPRIGHDRLLLRIGWSFRTGSGATPTSTIPKYFDGDVPWVNTSDLRDNVITAVRRSVTHEALRDFTPLRIYPPGVLLIAMYGATIGRTGILGVAACTNQACCALLPDGRISVEYAFHWLVNFRPEIVSLASGGGQPNISQDVVRGLRIPVPVDRRKQEEVLAQINLLAAERAAGEELLTRGAERLQELKRSLITAAVTGEFDVTAADGSQVPV